MILKILLIILSLYNLLFSMEKNKVKDYQFYIIKNLENNYRKDVFEIMYAKYNEENKAKYQANKDKLKRLIDNMGISNFKLDYVLFSMVNTGNFLELLGYLLNNIDINTRDSYGNTPFILAARYDKLSSVKTLLNYKDLNINAVDNRGRSGLIYAFFNSNLEILEILLEREDININIADNENNTLLDYAIKFSDISMAERLLKRDDINLISDNCFLDACDKGLVNIVNILLNKGKDINLKNKFGETGLILSVKAGHEDTVKLLLENGANVNIKDNHGKSVLDYSILNNRDNILKLLSNKKNLEDPDAPQIKNNKIKDKFIKLGLSTTLIGLTIYIFNKIRKSKKTKEANLQENKQLNRFEIIKYIKKNI